MEDSQGLKPIYSRFLRTEEKNLLLFLLDKKLKVNNLDSFLSQAQVVDMDDGGMGSLRFLADKKKKQKMGSAITEAQYTDSDGVLVSITVNIDEEGLLYELDCWKVDFSPLKRYPTPEEVTIIK